MTILLASNSAIAINKIKKLVNKPAKDIKVAMITTASKGGVPTLDYLDKAKKLLTAQGYDFTEFDIETVSEKEIEQILNSDVMFMEGGNVYYLMRAIRQTGFDKIIKQFLGQGNVYIGASAGSYVMCPSIEMGDWKTPDRDKFGLIDFKGLNYVPFCLFAHYQPEHDKILQQKIPNLKHPLRILKDGQAILVKDKKIELVGEGQEIIIK